MQLQRIDIYLLVVLFIQVLLLFEAMNRLGFNTIQSLTIAPTLSAAVEVTLFTLTIIFSLKGCQKCVDAFFVEGKLQVAEARGAGYAMIMTGFLLVSLLIATRAFISY